MGKNDKNIGKKVFWCSISFQPNLVNLQPVTAFISTAGKPSSSGPEATIQSLQDCFLQKEARVCVSNAFVLEDSMFK